MYIAKLEHGPKRVQKTLSIILEMVFKMVGWRGRKWNLIKRIFEVEVFFSSRNIDFPFYLKRHLELFFSLSLFFYMLCLFRTQGVLMIFEEKITYSKTSFEKA
jgi:hypothetical protein